MERLDSSKSANPPGDETLAGTLAGTLPSDASAQAWGKLEPGERLGRYVLLRSIGRGTMGQVYGAYDPELDRQVALKVLRGQGDTERLRGEAQAMARLVHPNVVTVFDYLVVDQRSVITMELVVGSTLGEWLAAEPRRPPQIIAVFVAAGRGLAAAHRAGLVHRDFKPANVLLSTADGTDTPRVLVADFGLVSVDVAEATQSNRQRVSTPVAGTPRYMAPEQFAGGVVDARADQWAFCVALHEALLGSPPFQGDGVAELAAAVVQGVRSPAPRRPGVARSVLSAIDRGLSADAGDRFATMDELLEHIVPATGRSRKLLTGLALLGAGAAAIWNAPTAPTVVGCREQDALVWSADDRAAADAAFSGVTTGMVVPWQTLQATTASYLERAEAQRQSACTAYMAGTLQERALRARLRCLENAAIPLLERTKLWLEADHTIGARAAAHVASRPPLSRCEDVAEQVARHDALDADARRGLLRIRAKALALNEAGRDDEALALLQATTDDGLAISGASADFLASQAHVKLELKDQAGALADYWRATAIGIAAGEHAAAANALAWILLTEGTNGRIDLALSLADVAMSLTPGNDWVRHRVLNHVGYVKQKTGDLDGAKVAWTEALDAASRVGDVAPDASAAVQGNLAVLAAQRGDYAVALQQFARVAATKGEIFGPQSITRLVMLLNALRAAVRLDDRERVADLERDVVSVIEANAAAHPEKVVHGYQVLADLAAFSGDREAVFKQLARGIETLTAADIRVANSLSRLHYMVADTHLLLGDVEAANVAVTEALATCPPSEWDALVDAHLLNAEIQQARGNADRATGSLQAAEEGLGLVDSYRPRYASSVRQARAQVQERRGQPVKALLDLHRDRSRAPDATRFIAAGEHTVEARLLLKLGDLDTAFETAGLAVKVANNGEFTRRETQCEAQLVFARATRAYRGGAEADTAHAAARTCCAGTVPPMTACLSALDEIGR